MRVLIIDDNALNRAVLCGMLELPGLDIDEATDALSGLGMIDARDYDLVLLDLRMPGMDGAEALKAIRARRDHKSSLPVVIVTADTRPHLLQECLAAGADDFLYKPVDMDLLINTVGRVARSLRAGAGVLV